LSNLISKFGIPREPDRRPRAAAGIATGVWLSRTYGRAIGPADVVRVLTAADLAYVVIGAHAVNAYSGRPRTTADVDVIVQAPQAAAKTIAAAFPALLRRDMAACTRFADERLEAIDLIHISGSKLFRHLLKKTRSVRIKGGTLRIPTLEGILASKFHAMHLPQRGNSERHLGAADFMRVVGANRRIDLGALADLGDLIVAGGGARILKCVAETRAERRLEF
jgi:hypothetical protein